jgi:hypothetical protein
MKKLLPIIICGILVLTGLGVNASILSGNINLVKWKHIETKDIFFSDELDQEQPEQDWFGPVGSCPLVNGTPNYIIAQSFIPTKNVLTKVELMIGKNITATYDYTVAIRDNLSGEDLTSISVSAANITTDNFSWVEFDFTDILVIPGATYYIVSYTVNATDNWYAWGLKSNTTYPGTIYFSIDDEVTWTEEPGGDMTFRTYGINNQPPNPPIIFGPHYGKINVDYNFSLDTITNPEADQIYCYLDWGDGNTSSWVGPYSSGESIQASYAWAQPGNYTIKVKLRDSFGAESNWSEPFYIEIVKLKGAFLFGYFTNLIETEDLKIIQSQSFISFPSDAIFYKNRTVVISNESFFYFGKRFIFGGGNIAIL